MADSGISEGLVPSADNITSAAAIVLEQCEILGRLSSLPGKVSRSYLTHEHRACNEQVGAWMRNAGLAVEQDQAGNIWGAWHAVAAKPLTLIIGSHLDTVPNAGKYDGIVGVLLAISALELLKAQGETFPFNIEVVGFGDEEGTRFGTTLLGSRAVAGTWQKSWFELRDKAGNRLDAALVDFGCDPAKIQQASRASTPLLGYLEVHIEQGPVLEQAKLALGVVTSIAGARRFIIDLNGHTGHAGTVPMNMRQDALVAAAKAVLLIEQVARRYQVVATVGKLECAPGAPNVIPGHCQFTLDIRSGNDATRDFALGAIREQLELDAKHNNINVAWQEIHNANAVKCAPWCQRLFEQVIAEMGEAPLSLMSGAGHDAMSFAGVTDIGMLFIRCKGGVSHHPDESMTEADTAAALEAMVRALLKLRDDPGFASVQTSAIRR